jgi:uncharacterized integral membrane protein (TIGR00698 family)
MRQLLPGLLVVAGLALVARLLALAVAPWALAPGVEVIFGMLLGLLVANAVALPAEITAGARFASQRILRLGIILIGARFSLGDVAMVGFGALGLVVACMTAAFAFALFVGTRLGLPPRLALLIGVGTAVCGNSAILATAPVVKAEDREVSFAVGTITIFGTLAVLLYPLIGRALGLDVLTYGLWAGVAVNDTAQTVAAGAAYSTVARDVATVVKLVRNTLMAPLILLIAWWCATRLAGNGAGAGAGAAKAFPLFVLGFLVMAGLRSAHLLDPPTLRAIDEVTKVCFLMALTGLGLHTSLWQMRAVGARPFLLGLGTASLLSIVSLSLIVGLHVGPARTMVEAAGPAPTGEAPTFALQGRVVAVGIPGASAISPVGTFHAGSPIRDDRAFAPSTQPGQVLDPTRLLVASTSAFGAAPGYAGYAPGSILSLTTDQSEPLLVPPDVGQTADPSGRVRLFTGQSGPFLNRHSPPRSATADLPAVSNPLGISINNAFGRPWFASAPQGSRGIGLSTVIDPDGRPLIDAPHLAAGGVFAGALTNRTPQRLAGNLDAGAVGTAFLGASPDGTGKAVFVVLTADGALAQVQVERGVDGLSPPETITALQDVGIPPAGTSVGLRRAGLAFNWIPDRLLFITDPQRNALVQLRLRDDQEIFHVAESRRIELAALNQPIDLAPVVQEVANPSFSSNTTLAGGADLYVANRGNGTIARLTQDGRLVAIAQVELPGLGPIGPDRLHGIAVSPDARTVWVTLSGELPSYPGQEGIVVALPAFGVTGPQPGR